MNTVRYIYGHTFVVDFLVVLGPAGTGADVGLFGVDVDVDVGFGFGFGLRVVIVVTMSPSSGLGGVAGGFAQSGCKCNANAQ